MGLSLDVQGMMVSCQARPQMWPSTGVLGCPGVPLRLGTRISLDVMKPGGKAGRIIDLTIRGRWFGCAALYQGLVGNLGHAKWFLYKRVFSELFGFSVVCRSGLYPGWCTIYLPEGDCSVPLYS